jgi:predicted nucleic acid-binding protein
MRLVIADTGPLNYLVLIDSIDILPKLFDTIFIPAAVCDELRDEDAPAAVRKWIARPPRWLEVRPNPENATHVISTLNKGEQAAIALASSLKADLILMDDRAGVAAANKQGFHVTGTLGVLGVAAQQGLVDLAEMIARLKATNFRYRQEILDALLAKHKQKTGKR